MVIQNTFIIFAVRQTNKTMILLCIFIPLAFVVAFMLIQIHYSLKEERKLKKRMDQFPKAKKINNYSPTKK